MEIQGSGDRDPEIWFGWLWILVGFCVGLVGLGWLLAGFGWLWLLIGSLTTCNFFLKLATTYITI